MIKRWGAVDSLLAFALFAFSWLYRFNDPDGGLAGGLLDDHHFYLAHGWQMLAGAWPDRDFVDPGAPLMFLFEVLAQQFGRGTASEYVFCVTALSVATALTYLAGRMMTGSRMLALLVALFQMAFQARLYSYPKVLVYAALVPVLWAYIDLPTRRKRIALAVICVVGLLLRHDHGLFSGVVTVVAIAVSNASWRDRATHAAGFALLLFLVVSPYLGYLQTYGGIVRHVAAAKSWADRDRARAPFQLPSFSMPEPPDAKEDDWYQKGLFRVAHHNGEPLLLGLVVLIPSVMLVVLVLSSDAGRPEWPRARAKLAVVTALDALLIWGFLRGNLESRFGDVSVPTALLALSLVISAWMFARRGRWRLRGREWRVPMPLRATVGVAGGLVVIGTLVVFTSSFVNRLDLAGMLKRPVTRPFGWSDRFGVIRERMGQTWPLERWHRFEQAGDVKLAFYLRDCTEPTDRVFLTTYLHYVATLAQRPFAGGHADLRAGFFTTTADQRLTVDRLTRESVPVVITATGEEQEHFAKDLPLVQRYLLEHYRPLGEFDLGGSRPVGLLVRRDRVSPGPYAFNKEWPCFR